MKTVLVTGAGGYIGSVLVPKLLVKGYKVKAVDRFFFGQETLTENKNLIKIKDDSRRLKHDLFEDVDFVIDLVAISNDPSAELFSKETMEINFESRVSTAKMAKENGAKRYILPSSASIYGFSDKKVSETDRTNPLTVYARANEKAEQSCLPLGSDDFVVTVIRQATVFGLSPRMRFDLAVNAMTYFAIRKGKLPLMRDGKQFRPMVHIEDTTDLMIHLLTVEAGLINSEIFNIGSEKNNFQIEPLAKLIAEIVHETLNLSVEIEFYGDPDHRNYLLSFDKVEKTLNWKAKRSIEDGVKEIVHAVDENIIHKTDKTITLDWYKKLTEDKNLRKEVEMYGGVLDIS